MVHVSTDVEGGVIAAVGWIIFCVIPWPADAVQPLAAVTVTV